MEIRKRPHKPARAGVGPAGSAQRRKAAERAAVGILAVGLVATSVALTFGAGAEGPAARGVETPTYASPEEIARNWPGFRGPDGSGVYTGGPVAASWNGENGEGILWKTEVPLPGASSPVVWEDRVFLSGADKKRREVYCFDGGTGALMWTSKVGEASPSGPKDVWNEFCYAASTPVTDGRRVCAVFANGDVACFDVEGNRLWQVNLGIPDNEYGHASSPALYRGLLIIQYDQGGEEDGKSKLIALDLTSGRAVWEAGRAVGQSWASPIVIDAGGRTLVVCCSVPWVIAYDVDTGKEVWRAKTLEYGYHGVPSPVFAAGLVFATDEGAVLAAIRPDGTGDVTATHVAWQVEDDLPAVCSPVSDGELLFTLTAGGRFCCCEASSGKVLWRHDFEGGTAFEASPCVAGDRLYLISDSGTTHVVKAARDFEEAGRGELGEAYKGAGPAFHNGRIYIRAEKHLFCIGGK